MVSTVGLERRQSVNDALQVLTCAVPCEPLVQVMLSDLCWHELWVRLQGLSFYPPARARHLRYPNVQLRVQQNQTHCLSESKDHPLKTRHERAAEESGGLKIS